MTVRVNVESASLSAGPVTVATSLLDMARASRPLGQRGATARRAGRSNMLETTIGCRRRGSHLWPLVEFVSSIAPGRNTADFAKICAFSLFGRNIGPTPRVAHVPSVPSSTSGAPGALRVSGVAEERRGLAVRALVCPAAAVAPLPGQLVEAELLSDGLRLPLLLLVLPLKPREQQLPLVHARLRNRTRGRRIRTRRRRLRGLAQPRPRHLRGDSQSVSHSHTPRKKRVGDTGHLTLTSPGRAGVSPARRTGASSRAWRARAAPGAWAARTRFGPR